ncbi:transcriptional regulator [Chitinivorax tropicus]|uniref:Transcriptional regulator n=1 Tax=Chitinivorax tropicus TaxID=714531 RepID=A0A840MLP3_9PROT|nr:FMN-binding negative transcriptional regulator [Chitinivorax tropicus]MBB5018049.1 transcriptional regulator [Chitinivorax tropicus]
MYSPAHFQENDLSVLVDLIRQFPLATVIRHGATGLEADHIPLLYETNPDTPGKLLGHVARQNPLWEQSAGQELLVVFQGPSTYISPNWYATKPETGKVVPTWNYAVVHAYCTLTALPDSADVLPIVRRLTDHHEATQANPWRVSDAPDEFIAQLANHIVGIELQINRLQGKWKVSQNQPACNRQSVAQSLCAQGSDTQDHMAQLVQAHSQSM